MHLLQLKDHAAAIQVSHGDILLKRVLVVDDKNHVHLDFGSMGEPETAADPEPRKLLTIAEAEDIAGTLEQRLQSCLSPHDIVRLTAEELAQLLEIRAELRGSYDAGKSAGPKLVEQEQTRELTAEERAAIAKEMAAGMAGRWAEAQAPMQRETDPADGRGIVDPTQTIEAEKPAES